MWGLYHMDKQQKIVNDFYAGMPPRQLAQATFELMQPEVEFDPSHYTLNGTLNWAVECCWEALNTDDLEEHGGIIMFHKESGKYEFVFLHNVNTGKPLANVLWTASQDEYAKKIIPMLRKGYTQYASFHTHPQFMARPSQIDLTELFPGFTANYIYSPVEKAARRFDYDNESKEFVNTTIVWDRITIKNGQSNTKN